MVRCSSKMPRLQHHVCPRSSQFVRGLSTGPNSLDRHWLQQHRPHETNLSFARLPLSRFISDFLIVEKVEEQDSTTVLRARANLDLGWGRLFGGQPLGQALSAATATVAPGMRAHSMSALFVREGSLSSAPLFQVDKIRDGRSFCSRRVRAFQEHGTILEAQVTFHVDEPGLEHQYDGADPLGVVQHPDDLPSTRKRMEEIAREKNKPLDRVIPTLLQKIFLDETQPMVIKPENPKDVLEVEGPLEPKNRNFIRINANGTDSVPSGSDKVTRDLVASDESLTALQEPLSEQQLSQIMLAFASDFSFFSTAFNPHGTTVWKNELQPASLSHSMYFHRDFTLRDWVMFDIISPVSAGARGFVRGEMFDIKSGRLVASAFQEGLMRPRKTMAGREKKMSLWS